MGFAEHIALEQIESAAMADFFRAAPAPLRAAHGIEARPVAGATLLLSRGIEPGALFRRVTGLGVGRPASEADLEAVLEPMVALQGQFAVVAGPASEPPALLQWLQDRGFSRGYAWMKFRRDCDLPLAAPTSLDVRVIDREHGAAFGHVIAEGFGLQPAVSQWAGQLPGRAGWCCVMAFDGDAPVAAGATFISGAYAWLGFGATLASHRRRGAQNALLARRLAEAAVRGARVAAVETGEQQVDKPSNSYRNILRSGFTEAYLRQNFISPAQR
jgi:GNAT superfamily N-acetyltransferase